MCEICSRLVKKKPERCQQPAADFRHCSGVFIVKFEQVNVAESSASEYFFHQYVLSHITYQ